MCYFFNLRFSFVSIETSVCVLSNVINNAINWIINSLSTMHRPACDKSIRRDFSAESSLVALHNVTCCFLSRRSNERNNSSPNEIIAVFLHLLKRSLLINRGTSHVKRRTSVWILHLIYVEFNYQRGNGIVKYFRRTIFRRILDRWKIYAKIMNNRTIYLCHTSVEISQISRDFFFLLFPFFFRYRRWSKNVHR